MSISHEVITKFCFVTHDLEKAVQQWAEGVKAGPFYVMASAAGFFGERSYRGAPARDDFKAALGFSGNVLIEFIEPTNDEPSVFQEVLRTKGDMAVHHVYPDMRPLSAAEYDSMRDRYLELGYVAALDSAMPGGGRCIHFDASEQLGMYVELMQCSPDVYASFDKMRAAHASWDGDRPCREPTELFQ